MLRLNYNAQFKLTKDRHRFFNIDSQQTRDRFSCVKCCDILIDPRQSVCGCRFCYCCTIECILENTVTCPGCASDLLPVETNFNYDRAVEREISEMTMRCLNESCLYTSPMKLLFDHLDECEFRSTMCDACFDTYVHKEREEHIKVHCKLTKIECDYCAIWLTKRDLEEEHTNINGDREKLCDRWSGVCPMNCSEILHYNIKEHLISCPNVVTACGMASIGCVTRLRMIDMEDHEKTDTVRHFRLLLSAFDLCKEENNVMKCKVSEDNLKLNQEIGEIKYKLSDHFKIIDRLTVKIKNCESNYINLAEEAFVLRNRYGDLKEKYGEYTWKIDNIIDKIEDAKRGDNISILSKPFYTDNPGYKILLKVYPNGDGACSGRSVSMYFLIAKGEYDEKLIWPFTMKMSMSLVSTRPGQESMTINMRPDINARCYGKPVSEYNLAAGQPNFISHSDLTGTSSFVDNNSITVFAKVMI